MGTRLDNAKALYMEAIGDGSYVEAINAYAGGRYTQHSTPVKDGKDGFIEFFADFVQRNPDRDIEIVRGLHPAQSAGRRWRRGPTPASSERNGLDMQVARC